MTKKKIENDEFVPPWERDEGALLVTQPLPLPATVTAVMGNVVADLIAMQHARAAAGNGTATHWQNAQAHIRKAIECIGQQAEADRG